MSLANFKMRSSLDLGGTQITLKNTNIAQWASVLPWSITVPGGGIYGGLTYGSVGVASNVAWDGSNYKALSTAPCTSIALNNGAFSIHATESVAAGSNVDLDARQVVYISQAGSLFKNGNLSVYQQTGGSSPSLNVAGNSTTSTPYIDFTTRGDATDYDVRLITSGGTAGVSGKGIATLNCSKFAVTGTEITYGGKMAAGSIYSKYVNAGINVWIDLFKFNKNTSWGEYHHQFQVKCFTSENSGVQFWTLSGFIVYRSHATAYGDIFGFSYEPDHAEVHGASRAVSFRMTDKGVANGEQYIQVCSTSIYSPGLYISEVYNHEWSFDDASAVTWYP